MAQGTGPGKHPRQRLKPANHPFPMSAVADTRAAIKKILAAKKK